MAVLTPEISTGALIIPLAIICFFGSVMNDGIKELTIPTATEDISIIFVHLRKSGHRFHAFVIFI